MVDAQLVDPHIIAEWAGYGRADRADSGAFMAIKEMMRRTYSDSLTRAHNGFNVPADGMVILGPRWVQA